MKISKRLLAFALCVLLLVGILPAQTFAAETDAVKVEHNGETTYYADLQKALDGFAPSNNTYGGKYVITLLDNISGMTAVKNLQYPTEVLDITLDLNGYTITGNGTNIAVNINLGSNANGVASGTFTIKDSSGNNSGKITGGKGGVYVYGKDATLNFQGGTITGNHGASKGGGILVGDTAKLVMTGGVITGNSVTGSNAVGGNDGFGGGVFANFAEITGGVITGNSAYKGAAANGGKGGGFSTDVKGTVGYRSVNIANGVIYGNTAEVAGDDVMALTNGQTSNNAKLTLVIGTENWYIDGWNGTSQSAGATDRYDAENPVPYTDGGFTNLAKKAIGLKYVAPAVEEAAPEAPNNNNFYDSIFEFACNTKLDEPHQTTGVGVDTNYCEVADPVKNEAGEWTSEVTYNVKAAWERWIIRIYVAAYPGYEHAPHTELPEAITFTLKWDSEMEKWVYEGDDNIYDISCESAATKFTVTYTDGVEDEEVFADQEYTVDEGSATPAFNGEPTRDGYEFKGWDPAVAETVTADATYTAQWEKLPAYVAQLESTGEKFETLQAALDAAKALMVDAEHESQSITLLGNTTEDVTMNFVTGLSTANNFIITIDLNGYTVTGTGTKSVMTFGRTGSGGTDYKMVVTINDSSADKTGTVTGGNTSSGGAIKMDGTKFRPNDALIINGGNFVNNTATTSGGAIYSISTSLDVIINGGTFTGNTAKSGGAIYAYEVTVNGGVITGNTATGDTTTSGRGGGICLWGTISTLTVTGGQIYGNTASMYGDDIVFASTSTSANSSPFMSLISADKMNVEGVTGWFIDGYNGLVSNSAGLTDRFSAENAVEFTDYADFSKGEARGNAIALKATEVPNVAPDAPVAGTNSNVTESLIKIVCDVHGEKVYGWHFNAGKVITQPTWNEEDGIWTSEIQVEGIYSYYLFAFYNRESGINHKEVNDEPAVRITLKWDKTAEKWVTLDGEPVEVKVACQTAPDAPEFEDLSLFGIRVVPKDGAATPYLVKLYRDTVTYGEVKGNRTDGFTMDVTVAITDAYVNYWMNLRNLEGYTYVDSTPESVTFTLTYTGDLNADFDSVNVNNLWKLATEDGYVSTGAVAEVYVLPAAPAAPEQSNTTDKLVAIICDSDPTRHETVFGKWYPLGHCTTTSDVTWNADLNVWTVDVKIGSLYIMYVDQLEDANNGTIHELVDDITSVFTTLKWDAAAEKWVTLDGNPIELHTTCRTAPLAPTYNQVNSYQIKVWGDVNGVLSAFTTSIPEEGYITSDVYGSREEGFFVDVTVPLMEGDIYQATWIAKRNPGYFYNYDWNRTEKTVTFTLKYNGSLTGTLYGNRHASNTNYDWVLETTGKTYGVVSEAYLNQITCTVNLVIYRNGNTTTPYKTVYLGQIAKGETLDLNALDISEYYFSANGFKFDGWFNDGGWNQYKNNGSANGLDSIYINGWTNIVCMVTDYQMVVVHGVVNGDKNTAETIFTGKALYGENLIAWLDANVTLPEKPGYTANTWWNWDWYGHKFDDSKYVSGWTNVYVDYQANKYTLTLDPNGGKVDPSTITVTFNTAIGELPEATRSGYIFDGWVDADGNEVTAETIYTVPADSTITAKWIRHPGSGSGNVTKELFTIQCTTNHDHAWLCNWFGSHVSLVSGSVHWNEELGRWEAQAKIGSSMLSQINSTQPKNNYFGGIKHYYDTTNYVFDLYYDPDFTGMNSESKEVTGMWLPVEDYVVDVYCYDKPASPNISKITSTILWVRDTDPAFKSTAYTTKYGVNKLIDGTYTMSEMYEKDGKFYVDITITDLAPYIKALSEKNGKDYVLPDWDNHKSADDFKFTLYYSGSTTDYKQDGTGWSLDKTTLTSKEGSNGMSVWLTEQFTVTYTDGVGGKAFADMAYTVYAFNENGGNKDDWADFSATATPTVEDPSRYGYIFKGWTPEVAETVTDDVTYTAVWEIIPVNVYYYINGELVHSLVLTTEEEITAYNVYDYLYEKTGYTLTCWYEKAADIGNTYKAEPNVAQNFLNKKNLYLYGTSVANTYNVTLDANGGTVDPATLTVTFDAAVGTLPVPTKAGYTFVGWMDENGTKVIAETVYTIDGDSTWTASWSANTYSITLDAKGGEVDPAAVNVVFGKAVNTLPVPTKTGYSFGGWFDADGKEYTAETVYTVADDITLTAKWTANEYTITLNDGTEETTKTVTFDTAVGELPAPTKTGYTFGGWFDADGKEYTAETVYTVADNITLTAKWTANEYTITLNDGTEETTKTVTFDTAVGELPAPTKEGHTFGGWFDADGNEYTAETVYAVADNITLTAKWTANTYTVTLDDGNGNVVTIEVTYGESIGELPEPTREGYYFEGWVDADGNKVTAETVYASTDASTYTAVWSVIPNTGDEMLLIPAILMLLLSAAVVLYTAEQRRKAER